MLKRKLRRMFFWIFDHYIFFNYCWKMLLQLFDFLSSVSVFLYREMFGGTNFEMVLCVCCTLRSWLYEIPTMIMTFPHGLENNHACKWISDNFPGMLTFILFLENCPKSISMHGYSAIHVEWSFFFLKLLDTFVP